MKKIVAGGIFLFCGVVLYLGIFNLAYIEIPKLETWYTHLGRLGTALKVIGGTTPFILSIIMMVAGACLLLWGCFLEDILLKKAGNKTETLEQ